MSRQVGGDPIDSVKSLSFCRNCAAPAHAGDGVFCSSCTQPTSRLKGKEPTERRSLSISSDVGSDTRTPWITKVCHGLRILGKAERVKGGGHLTLEHRPRNLPGQMLTFPDEPFVRETRRKFDCGGENQTLGSLRRKLIKIHDAVGRSIWLSRATSLGMSRRSAVQVQEEKDNGELCAVMKVSLS